MPASFALYFALSGINKSAMIMAAAFLGLFVVLELTVYPFTLSSLLTLSQNYVNATSGATQAAIAASMSSTWNVWWLSGIRGLFQSIGSLIASIVMLRGIFRRLVAYVGIVASVAGIIESFGVLFPTSFYINILFIVSIPLSTIWMVLAGYRLYRLGKG
jgi:hypothetical protein